MLIQSIPSLTLAPPPPRFFCLLRASVTPCGHTRVCVCVCVCMCMVVDQRNFTI